MKTPSAPRAVREIAIGGALAFATSSLIGVYAYAVAFAEPAAAASLLGPVTINLVLFTAFGAHHSVFARTGLKRTVRDWVGDSSGPVRPIGALFCYDVVVVTCSRRWLAGTGVGLALTAAELAERSRFTAAGQLTDVRDLRWSARRHRSTFARHQPSPRPA